MENQLKTTNLEKKVDSLRLNLLILFNKSFITSLGLTTNREIPTVYVSNKGKKLFFDEI
jgi:hypothetical protein